ncbi:MAG: hypothetical protein Q4G07_00195 [Oscillospiraceae bacterium]|nr:hypothetical protein [Oscillospiraceae bacterium]
MLPVFLAGAFFFSLLAVSGELTSVDEYAARAAAREPLIYQAAYTFGSESRFKALTARDRGAQVLAVGTSRVMQLRGEEFPAGDFYNAGGAVSSLGQIRPFLQYLPAESRPETVILCLDQFFFSGWDALSSPSQSYEPASPRFETADAFFRLLRDFSLGKIDPVAILTADKNVIGVSARSRGSGFLPDGSYRYGKTALAPDLSFPVEMEAVRDGSGRFLHADEVYAPALQELERLLDFCRAEGIAVVAFSPPYAPSLYAAMAESGGYGYLDGLAEKLGALCQKYGAEYYDFTCGPNAVDEEFIDGYHGGDRVYARMVKAMLEAGSLLNKYAAPAAIDALLALPGGNPRVIEIPE